MMLKHLVDRLTTTSIVGVDFGSAALKLVELAAREGQAVLRRCAVQALPGGGASAAVLKRLCDETGIATTHAALGLASPEVIVKPFQFPPMPKKELASAVRLAAEQAILNGHAPGDMAVDWHTLSRSQESIRGLLAVVPKAAVSARLETAKAAGLRPAVVDVEGLALWNAYWVLAGAQEPTPKTVLLVNVGAHTTNLVIAKGPDELLLIRDLQLGTTSLETDQTADWVAEVRDSLGYARSQGGLRTLDAVYVTGGGSGPKLIPLLKAVTPAPITFWNPLKQLARDAQCPAVDESAGPLLAIAIGLALRQPT